MENNSPLKHTHVFIQMSGLIALPVFWSEIEDGPVMAVSPEDQKVLDKAGKMKKVHDYFMVNREMFTFFIQGMEEFKKNTKGEVYGMVNGEQICRDEEVHFGFTFVVPKVREESKIITLFGE